MATLKYKSGSTWNELKLGGGGSRLDEFPVGSFYTTAYTAYGSKSNKYYTVPVKDLPSPAATIGGTWTLILYPVYTGNNNVGWLSLNVGQGASHDSSPSRPTAWVTEDYGSLGSMGYYQTSKYTGNDGYELKFPYQGTLPNTEVDLYFVFELYQRTA